MNQQGTILITVMLLLFVMSLLAMGGMESTQLEIKMTNNFQLKQESLQLAEAALHSAEKRLSKGASLSCQYPQHASNYFSSKSDNWWLSKATCLMHFDGREGYYVVETLGNDPCVGIQDKKDPKKIHLGVDYYRITVSNLLQTTIVLASKQNLKCGSPTTRAITSGRQSWREIR